MAERSGGTFSEYRRKVRDRRQAHELEEDVELQLDCDEQSKLVNWMESQDYHLQILGGVEGEKRERQEKHKTALKILHGGRVPDSPGFDNDHDLEKLAWDRISQIFGEKSSKKPPGSGSSLHGSGGLEEVEGAWYLPEEGGKWGEAQEKWWGAEKKRREAEKVLHEAKVKEWIEVKLAEEVLKAA
ncbi:hypothetical protein VTN77DRAFT_2229 [Rasamsonia byssochlamydoides]|uniref:uncharacterized protein n=1 Tax=Rasamsonia byssochlamydoides TaxID=89139 RepID=UPI0037424474